MKNKKIYPALTLASIIAFSTYLIGLNKSSANQNDGEFICVKVESPSELFNNKSKYKLKATNLNNVSKLKEIRDNLIKDNYNKIYRKYVTASPATYKEYYKESVNSEFGLDKFFYSKFKNLNESEILKNEIAFLNFLNDNDYCLSNDQNFIPSTYCTYESLLFRKNHGKENLIKQTKQMSENELKELFNFYLDNIDDFIAKSNSAPIFIYETVYPQGVDNLNNEFEKEIRNKYNMKSHMEINPKFKNSKAIERINEFYKIVKR